MLPPATEELADRLIASSLFWDTETSPRETSSEPTFSIFHSLGVNGYSQMSDAKCTERERLGLAASAQFLGHASIADSG